MSGTDNYERPATNTQMPADVSAPLFVYGMFRPDEIAYPRIEAHVDLWQPCRLQGIELERDGLRMIVARADEPHAPGAGGPSQVDGELITFKHGQESSAYAAISDLEPASYYKWETRQVTPQGGTPVEANLLVGRSVQHGTHRPDWKWRSRDDPTFVEAMAMARPGALDPVRIQSSQPQLIGFFKAQMQYLLLWTSIERYVSLRWGFAGGPVDRIRRFAQNEEAFRRAVQDEVLPDRDGEIVYRADRPASSPERLDRSDPVRAIRYYYQVRSNVSHRGKSAYQEETLLRRSLEELWKIFTRVLDETLGESTRLVDA